jgi:aminocarboxymuconate-semialdehyde decarboxylase
MEKWDVHTHTTLSPETFEPLARFSHYEKFIRVKAHAVKPCCAEMVDSKGNLFRVIEENAYNGAARIVDCDRHHVTMQVLSPTPALIPDYVDDVKDAAEICRILNDDNARMVAEHPGRFTALGAVPLHCPEAAIREMERIKALGMRGIEINSNVNGMDLDRSDLYPVFAAAAALDMAIFIHPWAGFMTPDSATLTRRMNANRDWLPWLAGMPLETALAFNALTRGGVHERLPRLRVLYAHGGGAFPAVIGRMEHGSYVRPDLFKERDSMNLYDLVRACGVYTDSLVHSPFAFQALLGLMGAGRIAMGSDYPYPLGEMDPLGQKGVYPGHMIEHLPGTDDDMGAAWAHFPWIGDKAADGAPRDLPRVTEEQRRRMLAGTAKEWLGYQ